MNSSQAWKSSTRHLVVGIGGTLLGHVDAHRRADEPLERQLVDGFALLGEVTRGVDVGAAVLGAHEAVGGVVVALLGDAGRFGDQLEAVFGRPVDRLGVEGMREVDQSVGVDFLCHRCRL